MSYKIAVIGDRGTTTGMSLAGVTHAYIHRTKDETLAKLREFLANEDIGLVLITHRVTGELGFDFHLMMRTKRLLPIVLQIPDKTGHVPEVDEFRETVKRIVGAGIVVKKEG